MFDWSQRNHRSSNRGFTSIAVTRLRTIRLTARAANSAWLSSMITMSPPLVPGPYSMKKFGKRGAQIGTVCEAALDVVEAELLAGFVDLGARPVQLAAPQRLLERVELAPSLPPAPPRSSERRPLIIGEVALALRHHPSGLALEHVE